jgi:hypothetical protein
LRSIVVILFAATGTAVAIETPSNPSVKVPAEPAVFAITILVITVDVEDGTVYRVVAVFVVAAPLNKDLGVFGISRLP